MRFLLLFLLVASSASFGGTRVTPNVGSNMSILTSNNTSYLSGSTLWKQGDTATSYIERLGRHTPVGVTPSRGVSLARIGSAAKDLIRLSPTSVAASVGLMAIIEGAGWAIDELTGQITAPDYITAPVNTSNYHWRVNQQGTGPAFATPVEAAQYYVSSMSYSCCTYSLGSGSLISSSTYEFKVIATRRDNGSTSSSYNRVYRHGSQCSSGYSYDNSIGACAISGKKPVTSSDINNLQITGDASFYDGLMRDACNLSASPSRCFDSLVEQRRLSGPATVQGPKSTTTSYQTNSDGTTSTVEKEVNTQYEIDYGDDSFVYSPKTTTNTKVDGDVVDTVVEKEDSAEDSEQKPEEEEPVSEIAGLQCEATVACSGDAIQCAIASTQKDTKCILQEIATIEETEVRQQVQQELSGPDYQPFGEGEGEFIDLSDVIDTSSTIAASCPVLPPLSFEIKGQTKTFEFSEYMSLLCEIAGWFGVFLVIFSMRQGVEIIARGFG